MKGLESLEAWKVGRRLALSAYRLTLLGPLERHYALSDQIRRAALSIPANVAEGYALGTQPQLVRHVRIALGSALELQQHLQIVGELNLVNAECMLEALTDCDREIGLLVGLLKHLGARVSTKR